MTTGLRELSDTDVDEALERVLVPRLSSMLAAREPGHCVRVSDIPVGLAARLCRRLRAVTEAQVNVLGQSPTVPDDVAITSTRLVELRNPDAAHRLRSPLLVFIPPGAHASAEDSFDVPTFAEVTVDDVYPELLERLHVSVPDSLRQAIGELFAMLDDESCEPVPLLAGPLERARFLLTIAHNDNDPQAAGAALFELGLIPDFELFTDPAQVRSRAARNLRQMRILHRADRSVRQRVIDLHLTDPAFRARLAAFLVSTGLDSPRDWTRRIVIDSTNWGLSFHRWPLPEERTAQPVRVTVTGLDLPLAGERPDHAEHPVLANLTGQPYLLAGAAGRPQLSVEFEADPDPRQITGLNAFQVQLMSEESGPTGVRAKIRVGTSARKAYKATLKKLRSAHLDDGWHYLQVLPVDADSVQLPIDTGGTDSPLGDRDPGMGHALNETDRFYVVTDNDLDEPPPQPRTPRSVGVTQELRRLEIASHAEGRDWHGIGCQHVSWKDPSQRAIEASFGAHGRVEVPLAPDLVTLEQRILADPAQLAGHRAVIGSGQPTQIQVGEPVTLPDSDPLAAFQQAREAVFAAIRGEDDMIVAGRDLGGLREEVLAYAEAYSHLLTWHLHRAQRLTDADTRRHLVALLQLDTVAVTYRDLYGSQLPLILVSPTHPLRLLWWATWAELGHRWLTTASDDRHHLVGAGQALLAMRPSGFPLVVVGGDGRLHVAATDLTAYWGACLPAGTDDPHTLLADVAAALGVPDYRVAEPAISAAKLADRLERYVVLHPYVRTLVICAVNAGRAELLADTLIELERRKQLRDLTYDVRLFTSPPQPPDTGEALASLLRGEWGTGAEAETFSTPRSAGITPKLAVAVRPLEEFRSATSRHAAHITMLFNAFSGERFGVGEADPAARLPIHGLIQRMSVTYDETDNGTVAWHKQPRHGRSHEIAGAEEFSDLLTTLPAIMSEAAVAVTTGETGTGMVPRITLDLTADDTALLYQAHRSSDWVVTVDRNVGVEYFDSPTSPRRPDYIIDFAPAGAEGLGHHMVVSSRSVDELRALLAPIIDQHALRIDGRHAGTFFDQLRLLSGQLVFKLASTAPNQRTEVLGLALARLYLQYQQVLSDQILVPLDAHLELYREARRKATQLIDNVGLHRTDLALFSLDAQRRTITCRLVEVKCHSSLNSIAEVEKLRDRIAEQLDRSATVLAENFDPVHTQPDRPDRIVRNAELAALLRLYLARAVRHAVMNPDAAAEAEWLLERLDWGYRLEFTKTGLIFDLAGSGVTRDSEGDIEYHRVGRDLIEELLGVIPTDPVLAAGKTSDTLASEAFATSDLSLPRPADATFRAPRRAHDLPADEPDPDMVDRSAAPNTSSAGQLDEPAATSRSTTPVPSTAHPPEPPAPPQDVADRAIVKPRSAEPPEIYLGSSSPSPQYGVLGQHSGRPIALDLNETHIISLFGVQGQGKSYTLGSIIEAATLHSPPANNLPHPLATIVFHYSRTLDYPPEFTSMVHSNPDDEQVRALREQYGVEPAALSDVVLLAPEAQVEQRRSEYQGIEVVPLRFGSNELRMAHWRFLMGAVGNQSTYIRQLGRIMRANRDQLTLDVIRDGIDQSSLSDSVKQLAHQRLVLATDYIDDTARIKDLVRPGRLIIVDLRDELIEKDEALGLFVVLMELFAEATNDGDRFNKLVVFDEAHKYIESPDLVAGLVESVREMRHKGMSILVASQDPLSVPIPLIELSTQVVLHRFNSPAWLKHLQKANAALADLTSRKLAALAPGEAYVWTSKATDAAFERGAVKVQLRPRITRHGGGTKTAIDNRPDRGGDRDDS